MFERIRGKEKLPPLPKRSKKQRIVTLIPKWEEQTSYESDAQRKADKRMALRQAINDSTDAETFAKKRNEPPFRARTQQAWEHMKKLRRHERRLETLLKHVFELKQENLQDRRARERIGDVLSVVEQVERAQNTLRIAFPAEPFPPELRILEGEEEQEAADQLFKIRGRIQEQKENEQARDFWKFLPDDEEKRMSGVKTRKRKKRVA